MLDVDTIPPPPPATPKPKAKKGPTGKPWRLTELAKRNLLASIEAGASITAACRASKVSLRTFCNWKLKAEKGMEPYATFMLDVETAKGRFEIRNVTVIVEAASSKGGKPADWRAAAWLLERNQYTGGFYRLDKPTRLEREAAKRDAEKHAREMGTANTKVVNFSVTIPADIPADPPDAPPDE